MPKYDRSDRASKEREFLGTRQYMAHHPVIRRLLRGGSRPTEFGHRVWETTLTVMRHLDRCRYDRVLEIGCGWGLLGVHLARRGANVTCSDVDPRLEAVVTAHAALNGVEVEFLAAGFADLDAFRLRRDLIVGVEICYSDAVVADLLGLLGRVAPPTEVLIADPGRPDFEELCAAAIPRWAASLTRIEDSELPGDET